MRVNNLDNNMYNSFYKLRNVHYLIYNPLVNFKEDKKTNSILRASDRKKVSLYSSSKFISKF